MRITRQASLAFTVAVAGLLTIGAVPASAQRATVASASGAMIPNASFAANATDTVNPAIGTEASVHLVVGADGRTIVTLHVKGMPANRSFGAHLHRDPCSNMFGGPHYQAPTGTPAGFADPDHEVWLDFTTNKAGNGRSLAVVPFEVQPGARSVIIHQGDHTGPGGAVAPSQRLACLNVTI